MSAAAARGGLLIVMASARPGGATGRAVAQLSALLAREHEILDLSALTIRPFDYAQPRQDDDFETIVKRMLAHRALLMATPVYWYAMSGHLKTLFDRFSDLLSGRDEERRGRQLAGRDLWMLAVGADPELPAGFETPFRATADYLALAWRGGLYLQEGEGAADARRLRDFAARLDGAA